MGSDEAEVNDVQVFYPYYMSFMNKKSILMKALTDVCKEHFCIMWHSHGLKCLKMFWKLIILNKTEYIYCDVILINAVI